LVGEVVGEVGIRGSVKKKENSVDKSAAERLGSAWQCLVKNIHVGREAGVAEACSAERQPKE